MIRNTKIWLAARQLKADTPQKRMQAVQKLRALDDPAAVEALLGALEDPEAAVRSEVVSALGELRAAGAVKPLIAALRDPSDAVQELAIQALRKIGDASVIEPLVGVLLRGTPGVQYHAAQALHAMGWTPRTLGEQIPFYVANGDFKRVTMFGTPAVGALAAVLRAGSYERRVGAAGALGEMGDPGGLKPLLAALKDSEAVVRAAAAAALAQLGSAQAVPELIILLRDRVRNVRVAALTALGQLGDPVAIESMAALTNDREWEVRAALAEALGRLGDRRALPTVQELLKESDPEVRQNAADALGKLNDDSAIESLVMAMVDEHTGVRQAAARAIALVDPYWERSERVAALLPQLMEAVRRGDPGVQFAASGLLRRLTGRTVSELQTEHLHMPGQVSKGDRVADLLIVLLRDRDEAVRLGAAEALGRLRLPASLTALQSALHDPSPWVKAAVEYGLQRLTVEA
jgi:HEAT repeat protein